MVLERAAALAAGALLLVGCGSEPAPSLSEMRDYRISLFSEQELRDLHAKATKEFHTIRAFEAEALKAARAAAPEKPRPAECADRFFAMKNELQCSSHTSFLDVSMAQSPDAIFEQHLMGQCAFVRTARAARRARCMPEE